uniref:Uncharacterized protein n=1 Tax=Arundo donax TaxID=35708 RepID=A0A0A8ZLB8_ARUDO
MLTGYSLFFFLF